MEVRGKGGWPLSQMIDFVFFVFFVFYVFFVFFVFFVFLTDDVPRVAQIQHENGAAGVLATSTRTFYHRKKLHVLYEEGG